MFGYQMTIESILLAYIKGDNFKLFYKSAENIIRFLMLPFHIVFICLLIVFEISNGLLWIVKIPSNFIDYMIDVNKKDFTIAIVFIYMIGLPLKLALLFLEIALRVFLNLVYIPILIVTFIGSYYSIPINQYLEKSTYTYKADIPSKKINILTQNLIIVLLSIFNLALLGIV